MLNANYYNELLIYYYIIFEQHIQNKSRTHSDTKNNQNKSNNAKQCNAKSCEAKQCDAKLGPTDWDVWELFFKLESIYIVFETY